ncbi:hypothetical protein GPX89_08705 [Nocardia sp. ET3-3]|uniref:Uncharacterized protein n=1 Tax=Nocardia terrae TaxID=2675851 RepID=A0A7K1USM5_9NOCA|nr:hypothetical protein [Nocardia terrae]MVU77325.1 hypothetical protein [Nocardia terrae]
MIQPVAESTPGLRVGDLVEVRSAAEILATLDERGELDNLPFMPEMLEFCGQQLTVHKVATKVCDPYGRTGMHRMTSTVHLTGARCAGTSHGGCQTACSLYWKEAWLRRVAPGTPPTASNGTRIDLELLEVNTRKPPLDSGRDRYSCQSTEMMRAAPTCLPFRDVRQYVEDVQVGNATVRESLRAFFFASFNRLQAVSKRVLPARLQFRGGAEWGFVRGRAVGKTPVAHLDLQPGELVRIKSKEQIELTLNEHRLNRGMGFEEEAARFCGRTARVQARITRCLDETTGELVIMKTPAIVLEDVFCEGVYHANCPREYVSFWREIWLERV